jgi:hypothetical protein
VSCCGALSITKEIIMSTAFCDPQKTKVIAVQDSIDTQVIHIYDLKDNLWIVSMDYTSFASLFGNKAHNAMFDPFVGTAKLELELTVTIYQK